jgi:hypothetical protein
MFTVVYLNESTSETSAHPHTAKDVLIFTQN